MSARFGIVSVLWLAACHGVSDQNIGTFNTPPNASIQSPTQDAAFDEGTAITFNAVVADDADVTQVGVGWTSDIDRELVAMDHPDPEGKVTYTTANLSPGNHVITLTAVDADAERGTDTVGVTVIDLPEAPTIEVLHPGDGESGRQGEPFGFEMVVSDAQDAPTALLAEVESDLDGPLCEFNIEATGRATCEGIASTGGTHQLTFRVTDTDDTVTEHQKFWVVTPLSQIDNDGDGFTEDQGDCDDGNNAVFPGANEVENGVDDNCNGKIDEGTNAYDDDGDGASENQGDCNDGNPLISPAATETCDGADNNCNSFVDEENATGCTVYHADKDRDTYGDPGSTKCLCAGAGDFIVLNGSDCYDSNGSAKPGQTAFFDVSRGDGSFDYNCDNVQTKELTDTFSCTGAVYVCLSVDRVGWSSGVPTCGASGPWASQCSANLSSCYASGPTSRTQRCN